MSNLRPRLALVAPHPVQYQAPWFAHLHRHLDATCRVFYLGDEGLRRSFDPGFGHEIAWDTDLLRGYDHAFLPRAGQAREIADWRPDAVLLLGYAHPDLLRLMASPQLHRLPILVRGDSHDLARTVFRDRAARVMRRFLFRRFSVALAVGTASRAYFLRSGFAPEKIFHAPHGIDPALFHQGETANRQALAFRRRWNIDPSHRVVLFAGKFQDKKRPDLLIRAFQEARLPRTTLLLVGAGPQEPGLRRLASASPDIRFVPFQNQMAMPGVYAAADLLVLSSQGRGETWGMVVQEAAAMGVPAIVTDEVGCQGDLVVSGVNGLICGAGDHAALATALQTAFQDEHRLARWGESARVISSRFTYAQATTGLRAALNAVVRPPARVPRLQIWAPEISGPGGAQASSRDLIRHLHFLRPGSVRVAVLKGEVIATLSGLPLFSSGGVPSFLRKLVHTARLAWEIIRHRPQLVIVTHLHLAPVAAILSRVVSFRFWVVAHGVEAWGRLPATHTRALARAEKILAVSACTAGRLKLSPERVALLPNTVDPVRFHPGPKPTHLLRRYGLRAKQPVLLTVARLAAAERYKGCDAVLDALPFVAKRHPDVCYLLCGTGDDSARLRRRVRLEGLEPRVILTGRVTDDDLADHYRLGDLYVMPSSGEGFGIAYLEALATGKPVIAGQGDGSREPLLEGRLGSLVDPDNPIELASAITTILEARPCDFGHLRPEVLKAFGPEAFRRRLAALLEAEACAAWPG